MYPGMYPVSHEMAGLHMLCWYFCDLCLEVYLHLLDF